VNRKYNNEHIEWLKKNINGCHFEELTDLFNERFGMGLRVCAMVSMAARYGLHNGLNTRITESNVSTQFKKGFIPWNKGKMGSGGWEPTQFKKGQMPVNYRPVGSERVNTEDYVEIKVADPRTWTYKHVFIWEEHNGLVPKGHVVIFGDGNRRNFDSGNLILVSKKQLVRLNQSHLIQNDADLTRTAIIMTDIHQKISERRKATR